MENLIRINEELKQELTAARELLRANEYDIMKYKLASDALSIALWDMDIVSGDPDDPDNKVTYSREIRDMLGFSDETDFPDVFDSWIDRLHPEDKKSTINAFAAHLNDYTGLTPYNIEYRLLMKDGREYRHFHALGTTVRDNAGVPLRAAGALIDITEKKQAEETLKRREKLLDALNQMDITLLSQKEKTFDDIMGESLRPIAGTANLDRIDIYRLVDTGEGQRLGQVYRWVKAKGKMIPTDEKLRVLPYIPVIENWIAEWSKGRVVNIHTSITSGDEFAFLNPLNVKSLLLTPVFINGELWGGVAFQDLVHERVFDDDSIGFLSSVARLCSNAIIKNEVKKELAETEERMRLMLDSTPLCCQLWDSSFRKIDCNEAAIRLFGFKDKQEFLNRYREIYPEYQPDGQRSMEKAAIYLKKAIDEGWCSFDWTYKMLDGTLMPAEAIFVRVSHGGNLAIAGYTRDLREHNKMMNEIYEREQELIRAHELNELQLTKLNLAVKATKIVLWDMEIVKDDPVNPSNTFIWSDEFRNLLGFANELDFPNILSSWSDRLHPEDKDRTLDSLEKHLLDISGKTPFDVECRLLKKNGEYAYYRASGDTIRDENGHALRIAGALMDVTETKNMLLEIEKQRTDAEFANKAKSDFLSTMSHEIRTPMNAILGITEIQLQNETLDCNVRETFDRIYVAGDLLLGIINDILDLSKIESGKLELTIDTYEIARLINDTAQLNMMRIGSKPIEFELYIDENLPALLSGDELRVKQILNNLLTNAFKYTEAGKVEFSISTETGDNDDMVILVLCVRDTGLGMTREQLDILFDKFTRFNNRDAKRTVEGTGLGMNITMNLVRMMNGEISVESAPGKGSAFTVRLPQGKAGPGVLGRDLAENLRRIQTSGRTQMKRAQIIREPMPYGRVLIVDDVETNLFVASGLLAPYGLKIDSTNSGFKAIELIKGGNLYDIVFMDHMMPKMDGMEAAKIIRGMGYHAPIVALTANAVAGQADMFLKNGFDDFIPKPIDLRQLNNVLNKMIRDKQTPEVIEAARRQSAGNTEQLPCKKSDTPIDPQIIEAFTRDASQFIAVLDSIDAKGPLSDEDRRIYNILIHGMKSALANIGKSELSAIASKLETAARDGDIELMKPETMAFTESLRAVVNDLTAKEETKNSETADENKPYLYEKLLAIKAACEDYDVKTLNDAIIQLREKSWSKSTNNLLAAISRYLLNSDFGEIVDVVDKYFGSVPDLTDPTR